MNTEINFGDCTADEIEAIFAEIDAAVLEMGNDDLPDIFAGSDAALAESADMLFTPQNEPQNAPEAKTAPAPTPPTKTRGNGLTTPVTLRLPLALLDWLKSEASRRGLPYQRLMISMLDQARQHATT